MAAEGVAALGGGGVTVRGPQSPPRCLISHPLGQVSMATVGWGKLGPLLPSPPILIRASEDSAACRAHLDTQQSRGGVEVREPQESPRDTWPLCNHVAFARSSPSLALGTHGPLYLSCSERPGSRCFHLVSCGKAAFWP